MLITKKSGEFEEFDIDKASQSVLRALESSRSPTKAGQLLIDVRKATNKALSKVVMTKHDDDFLSTDDIREAVEKELIKIDYYVAKAYMLYPYTKGGDINGI